MASSIVNLFIAYFRIEIEIIADSFFNGEGLIFSKRASKYIKIFGYLGTAVISAESTKIGFI
jgi:hypothetical protein